MKKIVLLTLLFFIASIHVDAAAKRKSHKKRGRSKSDSELRFGPRAGLTLSTMLISPEAASTGTLAGFHLGGVAEYMVSEKFSVEGGLFFNTKGTKSEYSTSMSIDTIMMDVNASSKIKPVYLEIPVNAMLKVDMAGYNWLLFAGPYLGLGIGGKVKSDFSYSSNIPGFDPSAFGLSSENRTIKYGSSDTDDMKRMDFGINFGAGWEFEGFQIRGTYGLGLSNLSTVSGSTVKNACYYLSLAYMIGQ